MEQDVPHLIPQPKPHHTSKDTSSSQVEDSNAVSMEEACTVVWLKCFVCLMQRLEE